MLVLFAAATVITVMAAGPTADPRPRTFSMATPAPHACKTNGRYEIADPALLYRDDGKAKMSVLGQLPKANHEKTVLRVIDGCTAPVVVGYAVGR
jgi:hypothetical protein